MGTTLRIEGQDRLLKILAEETVPVGKCCHQSTIVLGQPQIENPINNAGLGQLLPDYLNKFLSKRVGASLSLSLLLSKKQW